MNKNYFEDEINETRAAFNLEETISFQAKHDLQIIRGEDYQYGCWIDKKCYATGLTPLGALVFGIDVFKKN